MAHRKAVILAVFLGLAAAPSLGQLTRYQDLNFG
jgi:hypothetical protein